MTMNRLLVAMAFATLIGVSPASALEPIPGSITFGGQPAGKLQKAPVGSTVTHQFSYNGTEYRETYLIQPDRSLKLVGRRASSQN